MEKYGQYCQTAKKWKKKKKKRIVKIGIINAASNLKPVECLLTQNGKLKTFIIDYL